MPTFTIDKKTCYYEDIGIGFPLLLGHSYLWTSKMWEPQLQRLSKNYRCIVVDLWSHGNSAMLNEEEYTLEQLADDYYKLMQHLNIPEFAVIGLSVGGMWGTQMALKYPKAVKALVVMGSFVGSEPVEIRQKYFSLLDFIDKEKSFSPVLLDQIVPLFFSPSTLKQKRSLVEDFRNSLAAIKEERISGVTNLGRIIFSRPCLLDQLSNIAQPSLIVVGRDDIPRPPKEAEEMAARMPDAELHVIDHAGHICNLEQPEEVNELIFNFLVRKLYQK